MSNPSGPPWSAIAVAGAMSLLAAVAAMTTAPPRETQLLVRRDPPVAAAGFDPNVEAGADGSSTGEPTANGPSTDGSSTDGPSTDGSAASDSAGTAGESDRDRLVIQGVGDSNFDVSYIPNLGTNGHGFAFEGLRGLFFEDDLTVINLECAPSDFGQPEPKEFTFRCDPDALPVIADNGVEVVNLANNHSMDFGMQAMLDGRLRAEIAGLAPVGVGLNIDDATTPALFEVKGWTVAVLGMGGVVPTGWWLATEDGPGMASGDDIDQMVAAVERATQLADLVVVSIHWGQELVTEPDPEDRRRAEAMVAAGADVVFGHHSHRLGEVELIDGKPVFWTLGNFIWPRLSDAGATTAVARVVIEPDGTSTACLIPAFITVSGQPELTGQAPC